MIGIQCRRCGSTNLQRNGWTSSGQQKFYCKNCNLYGTLDTKDTERVQQRHLVRKLHQEQLSQRAIARITGLSRNTVSEIIKKKS